jgi:hypothetical protein
MSLGNSIGACLAILACCLAGAPFLFADDSPPRVISSTREDGYRGIWFTLGQFSEHGDKYSGGLGTYTAKHVPLAVYSPEAEKTFFVYGASKKGKRYLLAMASHYDHRTGTVPRPTIVHDKEGVDDPHDNPSISLDEHGHVWVFVSGRGRRRPGFIYRSVEPHGTDAFERVHEGEFTYPQPWWREGEGFLHLFTRYSRGRELYFATSGDGRDWSEAVKLAGMGGHYQVSNQHRGRVFTAFNMHPGGNVDLRTNLYYLETQDHGQSWQTVDGTTVSLPLTDRKGAGLVRDYEAEGRLVYVKDIQLDAQGHPVILIVTSAHHQPGPGGEPRRFTVVHWDGGEWRFHDVARTTHNYDMGSLYIEPETTWRVIAPTEPGPQRWGTGGEIAIWTSRDSGVTWEKERAVTSGSEFNHAYVRRPVNAREDFYAFWADGNPDELSPSRLYFIDKTGSRLRRLPYDMEGETAVPEEITP